MVNELAAALAVKKTVLIAAAGGAVVSLRFAPSITTWPGRALVVGQSFFLALYSAPFVAEQFSDTGSGQTFFALVLAVFGVSLCDKVAAMISDTNLAEIVAGWLKKPGN